MVIRVGNVSEVVNRLNYPYFSSVQTKILPVYLSSSIMLTFFINWRFKNKTSLREGGGNKAEIVVTCQYLQGQDTVLVSLPKQDRKESMKIGRAKREKNTER